MVDGAEHNGSTETVTKPDLDETLFLRFYRGLRRDVSYLIAEGHHKASHYPLAILWSEVRIAKQREAVRLQQHFTLMQMTIGSMFDKKMSKSLQQHLKGLVNGY